MNKKQDKKKTAHVPRFVLMLFLVGSVLWLGLHPTAWATPLQSPIGQSVPTSTPRPTRPPATIRPTNTATPTPCPGGVCPTNTPRPTRTPTPTPTWTPIPTITPFLTPTPTATPAEVFTETPTPELTETAGVTETVETTETPVDVPTETPTIPIDVPTDTPTGPTDTPTDPTDTPTGPTDTPTDPTDTPTDPTDTPVPTVPIPGGDGTPEPDDGGGGGGGGGGGDDKPLIQRPSYSGEKARAAGCFEAVYLADGRWVTYLPDGSWVREWMIGQYMLLPDVTRIVNNITPPCVSVSALVDGRGAVTWEDGSTTLLGDIDELSPTDIATLNVPDEVRIAIRGLQFQLLMQRVGLAMNPPQGEPLLVGEQSQPKVTSQMPRLAFTWLLSHFWSANVFPFDMP